MQVQAVVFDMDGVLIDSEVVWQQVRTTYAQEFGRQWTQEDQVAMLGRSTPDWSAQMRQRLGLHHLSDQEVAEAIIGRMLEAFASHVPFRPGAQQALHALAARYPVGLASGSPRALVERVLKTGGIAHCFNSVLCGDDVAHGKPHPEIYLRSLEQLGCAPDVAVGIEDAPNGLRALRNAGMWAIAAPCPEFPLDAESLLLAHGHIQSMAELTPELVAAVVLPR